MIINLCVVIIIISIKAIFSMGDTVFTYLNKAKFSQLSKRNDKKSKLINKLLNNKNKLFSIVKVGMTMCELFVSAFVSEVFVGEFVEELEVLPITLNQAYTIAVVVNTIILSYVSLIFGEILPKRIARIYPERTAYSIIFVLDLGAKIMYPFELIINMSEKFFARVLGIAEKKQEYLTEKELKMIIAEGHDQGIYDIAEKRLLNKALKFDALTVRQVMKSIDKVTVINIESKDSVIYKEICKCKYTRIPVYSKNINNMIGMINVKDIAIKYLEKTDEKIDIKKCIREPFFVYKNNKLSSVLDDMNINNKQMAIVKGQDGNIEGIITIEDIMEIVFGEMSDEFEEISKKIIN